MFRNVDFPQPMNPTIDTNSPCSTDRLARSSTCRADVAAPERLRDRGNFDECHYAALERELRFGHAHQAIEREADEADRQDREQDVRVDEAVVFLPEEAAHAGRARQHLARDDDQPCDAEAEAVAGEDVGQRRRDDDLREGREPREAQHFRDVPVVLRDGAHAGRAVDDRRPHRADGNGEHRRRLGFLEHDEAERQPCQRRDRPEDLNDRIEHAIAAWATCPSGGRAASRARCRGANPFVTRTRL